MLKMSGPTDKRSHGICDRSSKTVKELVIVDAQVEQWEILASGVRPECEVVVLHPHEDGIQQIAALLTADRPDGIQSGSLSTIHIISHGSADTLYLGNSILNRETLETLYSQAIQQWRQVLSDNAHILIYGCNVAAIDADASSQTSLLSLLRELTGANIAASSTAIGNAAQGGNWNLDYSTDPKQPALAFLPEVMANYPAVLGKGPGGVGTTDGTSTLELWLKGDAGVTQTANAVSAWGDQSGNGVSLDQPTAASQPTYNATGLNNQPTLTFDGTDDYLETAFNANLNSPQFDLFVVTKATGGAGTFRSVITSREVTPEARGYSLYAADVNTWQHWTGDGAAAWVKGGSSPVTADSWEVIAGNYDGTTQRTFTNGAEVDSIATTYPPNTSNPTRIGAGFRAGDPSLDFYLPGEIAEVLIYSNALNTAERTIVDNYLSSKYALTTATDKYVGDNAANGDYDLNVAGIGQEANGNNTTATSADLTIANNTYLQDNGDYLLFGHNQATNSLVTTDIPTGTTNRWNRVWYLDKTDTNTNNGTVDLTFDFSELGSTPTGTYTLLFRNGTTGAFSAVAGVTAGTISGNQVVFSGVDLSALADGYYTLGSDSSAPTLSSVSIASNNANDTSLAKVGDTVTVTFTASDPLSGTPTVTIGGQTATVTNTTGNTYEATYTLTDSDTEGAQAINIQFSDAGGNTGTATATTDSSSVSLDKTAPSLSAVSIASNNANDTSTATVGDTVTVTFTASETLSGTPTVTIGGQTATVTNTTGNSYEATYTLADGDSTGALGFNINFTDVVGNTGTSAATTDSSSVTFNATPDSIGLAFDNSEVITNPLNLGFTKLQESLTDSLGKLPIVGESVQTAVPNFFNNIKNQLSTGLSVSQVWDAAKFKQAIQDALSQDFANVTVSESVGANGELQAIVNLSQQYNPTVGLNGDLGLPGLKLNAQGDANTKFNYDFSLGLGLNEQGLFFDTNNTTLSLNTEASLADNFQGTSDVSLLPINLANNTNNPTQLTGDFQLSLQDLTADLGGVNDGKLTFSELDQGTYDLSYLIDTTLNTKGTLGFKARTNLGESAAIPSYSFDLNANFPELNYANGQWSGPQIPKLAFNNIQLDLGTFVADFAEPVMSTIDDIISPIKPLLTVFNGNIEPLSHFGIVREFFDINEDGKVTLIEVGAKITGNDIDTSFLDSLEYVIQANSLLVDLANSGGNITIDLGDYELDFDPTNPNAELKNAPKTQVKTTASSLEQAKSNSTTQELFNLFGKMDGLSFPILTPDNSVDLLLGKEDVTLFAYKLPDLDFEFNLGEEFPIFSIPVVNVGVNGTFGIDLAATSNLGFGFDTYGLAEWKKSGGTDYSKIFDGFYVSDRQNADGTGDDVHELKLTGGINLGGGVNVALAKAYLTGGLEANIKFDLLDVGEGEFSSSQFDGLREEVRAVLNEYSHLGVDPNLADDLNMNAENLYEEGKAKIREPAGSSVSAENVDTVRNEMWWKVHDVLGKVYNSSVEKALGTGDGKIRASEITSRISRPLSLFAINGDLKAVLDFVAEYYVPLSWYTAYEKRLAEVTLAEFRLGDYTSNKSRAIDPYISGGFVFFDANFNEVFDEDTEPFALTNPDGSFELDIQLDSFDLNGNGTIDPTEGQIILNEGVDASTYLPLVTPLTSIPGSEVVTPLTTMIAWLVEDGLDPASAENQVKTALGLPAEVNLSTYDPLFAIANGDPNGVAVFAAMIQVQNTIVQTAKLIEGGSDIAVVQLGHAAISGIAKFLKSNSSVDLTQLETIEAIVQDAISFSPSFGSEGNTVNAEQISSVASAAAEVMALGNQIVQELSTSGLPLTDIATEITKMQAVAVGQIAVGLPELAAGTLPVEEFLANNTKEAIEQKMAEVRVADPTVRPTFPSFNIEVDPAGPQLEDPSELSPWLPQQLLTNNDGEQLSDDKQIETAQPRKLSILLFDPAYYLAENVDVADAVANGTVRSAAEHFSLFGLAEGRSPSEVFTNLYLANNPDVADAVTNGSFRSAFQHFIKFGFAEGRFPSDLFKDFEMFYVSQNADAAEAIANGTYSNGLEHLVSVGFAEGRNPFVQFEMLTQTFDAKYYLSQNADVADAVENGIFRNAMEHFIYFGLSEGRNPSLAFSNPIYLANNPDVESAINEGSFASGYAHYLMHGFAEGRIGGAIAVNARTNFNLGDRALLTEQETDLLTGMDENTINSDLGDVDQLIGQPGAETFILGDANQAYYLNSADAVSGKEYAIVTNFDTSEDIIQLQGVSADYELAASPAGIPSGTAIYRNEGDSKDLIAVVQDVSELSLQSDYFSFV
ncbi:DUF4347 domain-containing protein [Oxynema aestuarii]|uniref:DUF4347 domain-containing protein n=1 Tax=Oxynema aestuarii AP17 TaxID=2064643 RepID=A0A6H1U428_9CYAN|nr:DUF4347 domain-containing protein [Oxynema aestuarii]QIZ72379.1 DUF4347 domain-containing protein [Oxynema aestuarii AP17]